MPTSPARNPIYRGYRFPAEIISYAVWLYYRFPLSHRDIEDLLAERGVGVSYDAVRLWCRTFGPAVAARLRRHRRRAGGKWHLDEVQLKIKGKKHWLWRAVDQDGLVLDILVQERRNQEAAERFLRRVLDGEERAPRVVVTDKLASYPPALRRVLPGVEHRRHKGLNNRAENSHRPVRKRPRTHGACSAIRTTYSGPDPAVHRTRPPAPARWRSRAASRAEPVRAGPTYRRARRRMTPAAP
ncbi:MAG: Mobile element protein [uncultured Chloroflexi bacterium]|uniref:Mobile element protein n=1 Tax=uncultured Chloroflexota bacterium TaxID=166587 RepID=A0A6J4J9Y5_9CHLR|nr:MAG: Mobile element protein [uncultured Chloroflexota bacterium]